MNRKLTTTIFTLFFALLCASSARADTREKVSTPKKLNLDAPQTLESLGADDEAESAGESQSSDSELFPSERGSRSFVEHAKYLRRYCRTNKHDPQCADVKLARSPNNRSFSEICKDDPLSEKCSEYRTQTMNKMLRVERQCGPNAKQSGRCKHMREAVAARPFY